MIIIRYCFNFACFSTAFGMTIFWFYKFLEDEDLVRVNLKPFETFPQGKYPMLSFCFLDDVFASSERERYSPTFIEQQYKLILKREGAYNGTEKIDFKNVTRNLTDFFLGDGIHFQDGSFQRGIFPNFLNNLPLATYSGYLSPLFLQCFGLSTGYTNVSSTFFRFNSSVFPNGIRSNSQLLAVFHLPNKISITGNSFKVIWPKRDKKQEFVMLFTLQQIEILKRRNRRDSPCLSDEVNFDQIDLDDHLERVGCRAPYQKTRKQLKICNSMDDLHDATSYQIQTRKSNTPCTSASTITHSFDEQDIDVMGSDWFHVQIMYPNQYKEIVMVKAVDLQTAIGNAGGYIGLFLGDKTLNINMIYNFDVHSLLLLIQFKNDSNRICNSTVA